MRFMVDMSIQMILSKSTLLIAAVGFFRIHNFVYSGQKALSAITEFFIRVSIAVSIEFAFNSLSFRLQMSYMNVAIDRVLKRRWRKHIDIALIVTAHCECQNVLKQHKKQCKLFEVNLKVLT